MENTKDKRFLYIPLEEIEPYEWKGKGISVYIYALLRSYSNVSYKNKKPIIPKGGVPMGAERISKITGIDSRPITTALKRISNENCIAVFYIQNHTTVTLVRSTTEPDIWERALNGNLWPYSYERLYAPDEQEKTNDKHRTTTESVVDNKTRTTTKSVVETATKSVVETTTESVVVTTTESVGYNKLYNNNSIIISDNNCCSNDNNNDDFVFDVGYYELAKSLGMTYFDLLDEEKKCNEKRKESGLNTDANFNDLQKWIKAGIENNFCRSYGQDEEMRLHQEEEQKAIHVQKLSLEHRNNTLKGITDSCRSITESHQIDVFARMYGKSTTDVAFLYETYELKDSIEPYTMEQLTDIQKRIEDFKQLQPVMTYDDVVECIHDEMAKAIAERDRQARQARKKATESQDESKYAWMQSTCFGQDAINRTKAMKNIGNPTTNNFDLQAELEMYTTGTKADELATFLGCSVGKVRDIAREYTGHATSSGMLQNELMQKIKANN